MSTWNSKRSTDFQLLPWMAISYHSYRQCNEKEKNNDIKYVNLWTIISAEVTEIRSYLETWTRKDAVNEEIDSHRKGVKVLRQGNSKLFGSHQQWQMGMEWELLFSLVWSRRLHGNMQDRAAGFTALGYCSVGYSHEMIK